VAYTNVPTVFVLGMPASMSRIGRTGIVTAYSITPSLPAGLQFNPTSGVISGVPSALSAAADYVITAHGPGGAGRDTVNIAVTTPVPTVSYTNDTITLNLNEVASLSRLGRTGIVTGYSISPALPAGLQFNQTSGVISGVASVLSAATDYVITAHGPGGSGRDTVCIAVTTPGPTVSYTNETVTFNLFETASLGRTSRHGIVTGYTISPALPAGLQFNSTSGIISGVASALSAPSDYVITATGPGGSGRDTVRIAVITPQPTVSYTDVPLTFTVGQDVGTIARTGRTGIVTGYVISPALPAGLRFNTTSGVIVGTPTTPVPADEYVVTVTGPGGEGRDTLTIAVNPNPPMIAFTVDTLHFVTGVPITAHRPVRSGGPITGWSMSTGSNGTSLTANTGLLFNPTTGFIYGTPQKASAPQRYSVMAYGLAGSADTAVIVISTAAPGAKVAAEATTFTLRLTGTVEGYALKVPDVDDQTSQVVISIYDPVGHRVWARAVDPRQGERSLTWDGRNREGRLLAAGMYLVRTELVRNGQRAIVVQGAHPVQR
jgi:hypothetical protein